ncbi:COPI beta [Acrasis kona]|uniref:Coatomer subunit beta n=1 Tax=Acrasis kona TaxID=1008807 RepID=A0AAW2YJX0_9EUKA
MSSNEQEKQCTQLVFYDKGFPTNKELRAQLENVNDPEEQFEGLKKLVLSELNGEPQNNLLMDVLKYILPSNDKRLKKLCMYYLETIDKNDKNGKLRSEMILACSHIQRLLEHPNEYVQGFALRFEADLLGPLIPSVKKSLEHRHSYVRKNAVLAIFSIYSDNDQLIPDAPELIEDFLNTEPEVAAKRNAFIMLFHCDQDRAVKYLRSIIDQIQTTGDLFQLAILNLLKKMAKNNPNERTKYLKVISSLLDSKSNAVLYQCAGTLVSLSASPVAIKAAASCYIKLLLTHSDNNVKLIVLDRIIELKERYPVVMQQVVMDLLRVLSNNPDMDIKKKVLETAMALVSSRNVDTVMSALKKELQKSQSTSETVEYDKQNETEYRRILVKTFHECAIKFPEVAHHVLSVMDYLSDTSGPDVVLFVREVVDTFPKLRQQILDKLCQNFSRIQAPRVFRVALWILGDYSETQDQIQQSFDTVKSALKDLLGTQTVHQDLEDDDDNLSVKSSSSSAYSKTTTTTTTSASNKNLLRADGTYAAQTGFDSAAAQTASASSSKKEAAKPPASLKGFVEENNFYLSSVICNTICKLASRMHKLEGVSDKIVNQIKADAMLIMTVIVKHSSDPSKNYRMDRDTQERINLCIKLLSQQPSQQVTDIIVNSKTAFGDILKQKKAKEVQEQQDKENKVTSASQPDNLINITQLKGKKFDAFEFEEEDISKATSNAAFNNGQSGGKLSRVTQLTGFSDPVYAEALVTVHQFDILLDVLVINQTNHTLQNLTLELATVGDLKLCERPQTYTMAPKSKQRIKANIKVSSTETGIIFGNIVYDQSGAGNETSCVILNDVHIDIMDYIAPATCDDMQFRAMWFEFEWENKIPVKSNVNAEEVSLRQYLNFITKATNMNCLTPELALAGECEFLSANLYARSSFGEDALANVSIEKLPDGKIDGFVRIRSKTQGIALSLGDKITKIQKAQVAPSQ